jgi:transposase
VKQREKLALPHSRCSCLLYSGGGSLTEMTHYGVMALAAKLAFVPSGLLVRQLVTDRGQITIHADLKGKAAACPTCCQPSSRIHSRYTRTLADLPWQGRTVSIALSIRRFRCAIATCSRKIFAERLSDLVVTRARRSCRLADIQRHIGLALGGATGERLSHRLALPASGDTLLRLIRGASSAQPRAAPTIIGIDDFAWKRGHRYGTVICDLKRRCIIDLLPDRQPATVEAWLAANPGIDVVARDRGAGYRHAVARACPQARQVADR